MVRENAGNCEEGTGEVGVLGELAGAVVFEADVGIQPRLTAMVIAAATRTARSLYAKEIAAWRWEGFMGSRDY